MVAGTWRGVCMCVCENEQALEVVRFIFIGGKGKRPTVSFLCVVLPGVMILSRQKMPILKQQKQIRELL